MVVRYNPRMKPPTVDSMSNQMMVGAGLMAGGFVGFLVSLIFFKSMVLGGLCVIAVIAGVFVLATTLGTGFRWNKANASATEEVSYDNCYIVARYAINEIGETVFSDFDPDDLMVKLYVQIEIPGSRPHEYRTTSGVWGQCGEGMRGIARIQGDWLASFQMVRPSSSDPMA